MKREPSEELKFKPLTPEEKEMLQKLCDGESKDIGWIGELETRRDLQKALVYAINRSRNWAKHDRIATKNWFYWEAEAERFSGETAECD